MHLPQLVVDQGMMVWCLFYVILVGCIIGFIHCRKQLRRRKHPTFGRRIGYVEAQNRVQGLNQMSVWLAPMQKSHRHGL